MGLFDFFKNKKKPVKQEFKEQRFLPRWKISAPAKIKCKGRSNYAACEIRDLNMKGCSLVMAEKFPEGCTNAEFYFSEKFFFDIEIALLWHKEADNKQTYGVKFTRIRDSDKEKIFLMMKESFPGHFYKNL